MSKALIFGLCFLAVGVFASADLFAGRNKVTICHIPPGNPQNAHTIKVGEPALSAHLAHGDQEGECGVGGNEESELDECDQTASLDNCVSSGIYY